MMELSEFIKTVLTEITQGIEDAQESLKEKDMLINPITKSDGTYDTAGKGSKRQIQNLEFDLSVSVSSETKKGASAIAVVSFFAGKGDISSINENISTNRLKFSIPVSLPTNTKGLTAKEVDENLRGIASSLY